MIFNICYSQADINTLGIAVLVFINSVTSVNFSLANYYHYKKGLKPFFLQISNIYCHARQKLVMPTLPLRSLIATGLRAGKQQPLKLASQTRDIQASIEDAHGRLKHSPHQINSDKLFLYVPQKQQTWPSEACLIEENSLISSSMCKQKTSLDTLLLELFPIVWLAQIHTATFFPCGPNPRLCSIICHCSILPETFWFVLPA